jgi:hypothetical protein
MAHGSWLMAHGSRTQELKNSRTQELFSLALIKFDIKLISHKLNCCQPTAVSFEPN